MFKKIDGLVLREVNYKESDKILTVLTKEGKYTIKSRGARRKGSRIAGASQLFAYSEMTLFEYKGRFSMNEAETKELFRGIREDVELLSLASYFSELLECVTDEDIANPDILSLALNSLYALDKLRKPPALVKSVFELKLMCLAGYAPYVSACSVCNEINPTEPRLNISGGVLHCAHCKEHLQGISMPLCSGALAAIRHIISKNTKLFSFTLEKRELEMLNNALEAYVAAQLERGFKTLDFYKSIKRNLGDKI